MKKISLIVIFSVFLSLLVSCNGSNSAKFINADTISYNEANYYQDKGNTVFSLYYTHASTLYLLDGLNPSKQMDMVGFTPLLSTIWVPKEEMFGDSIGDNILVEYSPWNNISYYFKESFELKPYDEVILDEIFICDFPQDIKVIDCAEADNITWKDIIDYEVEINEPIDNNYWIFATTIDYSDFIYSGIFYAVIVDDVVYLQTEVLSVYRYYKIVDEYQEIFKEAIDKANEQ